MLIGKARPKLERFELGYLDWLTNESTRNTPWKQQHPCTGRAYSTSTPGPGPSQEAYKQDPPIGALVEGKAAFQRGNLGEWLGDHLARHINSYFRGLDSSTQVLYGRAEFGEEQEVGLKHREAGRVRRRKMSLSQRLVNETAAPGDWTQEGAVAKEVPANRKEETTPAQVGGGVQLFHVSTFTTRLGETYRYVSRHINSVFSAGVAQKGLSGSVPGKRTSMTMKRRKNRSEVSSRLQVVGRGSAHGVEATRTMQDPGPFKAEDPGVWDEFYSNSFAQCINSYFKPKVSDAIHNQTARDALESRPLATATSAPDLPGLTADSTPQLKGTSSATNQWAEPPQHRSLSLFHISNLATSFGESYAQMAHHINRYFKGKGSEDDGEGELEGQEGGRPADWQVARHPSELQGRARSFTLTAITHLLGSCIGTTVAPDNPSATPAGTVWGAQPVGRQRQAEKTRVLVRELQQAACPASLHDCIEELNQHLILYPACSAVPWQEKAVALLLAHRRFHGDNQKLQDAIRETLALIGYVESVRGRGIRILSIDGGGMRGVVPLQVLKRLEVATGRRMHQLFDYISGVSTGAVLAFMLGLVRVSLEECEEMYRRFGSDVFRQNPLVGTVKMGWSHSYYNTSTWEELLREKMGDKVLIKTARDHLSPKVSAVSVVVNCGTMPKAFVFRNYNHAPGRLSRYSGGSGYQLWQAIRASSAAPGYFREFPLHGDIHQDGALFVNNPCALAVHESRLLWPSQPFQCVLSLGTGRYDNTKRSSTTSTSLRSKISSLISSATDTESVHTLLDDLLAANVYFRFNPMLSAEVSMDECRPETLEQLRSDTQRYLDRNQNKVERLCRVLRQERGAAQLAGDWVREQTWALRQRWA